MSLDAIQLPPSLYQSIFKNKLVDIRKNHFFPETKAKSKINFLGGNEKNIVFILNNALYKFLDDTQLKFLSGLIAACNITMADIAVVNFYQDKNTSYIELSDQLNARKVLSFGISAEMLGLPFSIPLFQIQAFQEIQYILCPTFEELQENTDLKKQLWVSFQKIFNITRQK